MENMVQTRKRHGRNAGFTLIEMMMALAVLAIGLGALTIVFYNSMATNSNNRFDAGATALSQMIMEQIAAQPANATQYILLTDCAGNSFRVDLTAAAATAGAGATLDSSGNIDWTKTAPTQATSSAQGFYVYYTACGASGSQPIYEVRWNSMTVSSNARLVTVGTRLKGTTSGEMGGLHFAIPVTLRTIGGR